MQHNRIEKGIEIDRIVQDFFRFQKITPEVEQFAKFPPVQSAIDSGQWCIQKSFRREIEGEWYIGIVDLILNNRLYEVKVSEKTASELSNFYFPQLIGYCTCLGIYPGGIFVYRPSRGVWEFADMSNYFNSLRSIRKCWLELLEIMK